MESSTDQHYCQVDIAIKNILAANLILKLSMTGTLGKFFKIIAHLLADSRIEIIYREIFARE